MDPNPSPRKMRILSYVMTKIPSFKRRQLQELENEKQIRASYLPETYSELSERESYTELAERVAQLTDDDILATIRSVVVEVSQIRSVLKTLGERPDPEAVDSARVKLHEMDSPFAQQLDEIAMAEGGVEEVESRRKAVKREKQMFRALISLDEMHDSYANLLIVAERRLQKLYETAKAAGKLNVLDRRASSMLPTIAEEVKEEMADILQDALINGVERIDLSRRRLPFIPEAFGKLRTLVSLNLSSNKLMVRLLTFYYFFFQSSSDRSKGIKSQISFSFLDSALINFFVSKQAIPDSVAGLTNLEALDVSANLFESLPDAIRSLKKLQILNVSRNKLTSLPDGLCKCR